MTPSEKVAEIRADMYIKQGGVCPLCTKPIEYEEAVLDHCHSSGRVRAVLHRTCNAGEGKIHNAIKRFYGMDTREENPEVYQLLRRLTYFWGCDYSDQPFHPTHRFPEHKEASRLRKQLKKNKDTKGSMRPSTIQKKKDRIKELQEIIKEKYG